MLITLFRGAGATGNVFFLKGGRPVDKGLAYSGLIGPKTTIAVVPTTLQILNFSSEARTKDKQVVTVSGDIKISLSAATALSQFDFTVDRKSGSYLNPWETALNTLVVGNVLAPIQETARGIDIEQAIQSHKAFEDAIMAHLSGQSQLGKLGIAIDSCSVESIEVDDEDVVEAIGSKERQEMLAASDAAIHGRRLKGAANDRAVKRYEAATALNLEGERGKLVEAQILNRGKEAAADAEAIRVRLAPFDAVEPGKVLGAALMEMARSGRIGNLSIVPEMLAALGQK
ncbi:MAG TPA: SPFH domain-containing protein [Candidatus Paceibacterota bacterium]|nr:SPFH domain-containing protein [Candidatus Paceibacterota bacterium]